MEHYKKVIDLQDQRAIEFRFQINNMTERIQFMEKTIEVTEFIKKYTNNYL